MIFKAKFTENVLDTCTYLESTIGPTMVGIGENASKLRFSDD